MKDIYTSPKTPINEEEVLLSVIVGTGTGEKASAGVGQTAKQLSSRPSNNVEEEEFQSYNQNIAHSSFERPLQSKKISGMALGGLTGQADTKNWTLYNTTQQMNGEWQQMNENNVELKEVQGVGMGDKEAAVIISAGSSRPIRKSQNNSQNNVQKI